MNDAQPSLAAPASRRPGPNRPPLGLLVAAPVAGRAMALSTVPDAVFADEMVGPGIAIDPAPEPVSALAPITGTLTTLRPHAFIVVAADGRAVLVHLGIDTVRMADAGFALLAVEGDEVSAGTPLVRWDPARVASSGRSPMCPVVALDAQDEAVLALAAGPVLAGAPLFRWC